MNDHSENLENSEVFEPGTVKPEQDYEDLARLGSMLGIPTMQMYIGIEVLNADGSAGDKYFDRSRTYNRNFWNKFFSTFVSPNLGSATFGAGFLATKQTGGAVTNIDYTGAYYNHDFVATATAGTTTQGIVVGTGTTAESFEAFALTAKVANGTSAGLLTYQAGSLVTAIYNSGTLTWTATCNRIFNNNSGAAIVIAETGIYEYQYSSVNHMTCRDLLSSTVSIPNGGQMTVTYTKTLVYPA